MTDACSNRSKSSYNPSINPAGGFFFDLHSEAWGDLAYTTTSAYRDCPTSFDILPGDIVGVHIDKAKGQVWWDVNDGNPLFPCQLVISNVSASLEYYGMVLLYDNGRHPFVLFCFVWGAFQLTRDDDRSAPRYLHWMRRAVRLDFLMAC